MHMCVQCVVGGIVGTCDDVSFWSAGVRWPGAGSFTFRTLIGFLRLNGLLM